MTRRPGMSLTEVLVALFILTIGVIGILTMFPLGAAQMARAVRDDRSAQAAAQADGFMRWYWQTNVVNPVVASGNLTANFPQTSLDANFTNGTGLFDVPSTWNSSLGMAANTPLATTPPTTLANLASAPGEAGNPGQVSFPVLVDPMGAAARGPYFGDSSASGFAPIPRCGLVGMANANPYRFCSLTDSLGFNDNGLPTPDLEMRYNWMWVLQRPQAVANVGSGPNNQGLFSMFNANKLSNVNMTVVVFDRRAYKYPPSSVQGFETVMQAVFTTGLTSVTIAAASSTNALDLKAGSWVMDASSVPAASPPIRQANFYRVVSATHVGANVTLELQAPVAAPTGYPPLGYTYTGTLVALSGVSGVFVRPQLTPYPQ